MMSFFWESHPASFNFIIIETTSFNLFSVIMINHFSLSMYDISIVFFCYSFLYYYTKIKKEFKEISLSLTFRHIRCFDSNMGEAKRNRICRVVR
jgi:hypothetical protein